MTETTVPSKWATAWVWLRLSAILLTIWMTQVFFGLQHYMDETSKLSSARTTQAAQLAGVPLSGEEQRAIGTGGVVPEPIAGSPADQIVAIGSIAALESDRASDSEDGMIAAATASVGSLVVFFAGLRAWSRRRTQRAADRAKAIRHHPAGQRARALADLPRAGLGNGSPSTS